MHLGISSCYFPILLHASVRLTNMFIYWRIYVVMHLATHTGWPQILQSQRRQQQERNDLNNTFIICVVKQLQFLNSVITSINSVITSISATIIQYMIKYLNNTIIQTLACSVTTDSMLEWYNSVRDFLLWWTISQLFS